MTDAKIIIEGTGPDIAEIGRVAADSMPHRAPIAITVGGVALRAVVAEVSTEKHRAVQAPDRADGRPEDLRPVAVDHIFQRCWGGPCRPGLMCFPCHERHRAGRVALWVFAALALLAFGT